MAIFCPLIRSASGCGSYWKIWSLNGRPSVCDKSEARINCFTSRLKKHDARNGAIVCSKSSDQARGTRPKTRTAGSHPAAQNEERNCKCKMKHMLKMAGRQSEEEETHEQPMGN